MNIAALIAVEKYQAAEIDDVRFAANDSQQFSDAIEAIGFDKSNQLQLANGFATKTTIESALRTTIESLTASDTFFLFYTGHGFSDGAANFLTCHDTQPSDPLATSLKLQDIFDLLQSSACTRIVLFLDPGQNGGIASSATSGAASNALSTEQVSAAVEESGNAVCLVSCGAGENSRPSNSNRHSAWAFNIIEAFRGNAVTALENGSRMTASSLQNYLKDAVPRTLRLDYADKIQQTPWMCGAGSNGFLLADLSDVLSEKTADAGPGTAQMTRVSFVGESEGNVNGLSGFVRGQHRVPDKFDDYTDGFARDLASEDIKEGLKDIFKALRSAFGFKRLDLETSSVEQGCGSIITPYFTYDTEVRLNPDDPGKVVYEYRVTDIKEPDRIFGDPFSDAFVEIFDTIEFTAFNSFTVEELVDRIEAIDDDRLQVDYDSECLRCSIRIEGLQASLEAEDGTLRLSTSKRDRPMQIVEKFFEAQRALTGTFGLRVIDFDDNE